MTTTPSSVSDDNDGKNRNQKKPRCESQSGEVPKGYEHIQEGQITMMYPKSENSVFYNPVQVQNRDLSVLMIGMYAERRIERVWTARKRKEVRRRLSEKEKVNDHQKDEKTLSKEERKAKLAEFERKIAKQVEVEKSSADFISLTRDSSQNTDGMTVLDALAASGLRSLRYWKEIPGVRAVVVNDLDPVAVDMAKENVVRNGFSNDLVGLENKNEDNGKKEVTTDETKPCNESDEKKQNSRETSFVPPLTPLHQRARGIHLQCGDATHEMYVSRLSPFLHHAQCNPTQLNFQKPQYDVIDLDPYGSAAPFLDSAVQSIVNGGLLAVTCTDMAALGGSRPETCYGRYGAFPIQRSGYLQELALRILLYHMSVVAGRHGRTIRPVLSVGMAFYVRVFVEVYDDKAGVNDLSLNHGLVFQSTQCSSFHVTPFATNTSAKPQKTKASSDEKKSTKNTYRNGRGPYEFGEPVCSETGAPYKIGGPCWIGPLHNMDVVKDAISRLENAKENSGVNSDRGVPIYPLHTATTLHGLLVSVSEELPDAPLYHTLPNLCRAVNSPSMPMLSFRSALVNAGFDVSSYHKEPQAIKTDAPNHVVWDIVRAWCKKHPPHQKKDDKKLSKDQMIKASEENSSGKSGAAENEPRRDIATTILSNKIRTKVDFTKPPGLGKRKKARRYAINPEPNWGPKKAASGKNKRKRSCEEEM